MNEGDSCQWDDVPYCVEHGNFAEDSWETVRQNKPCTPKPNKGWIVACDTTYYPSVQWFETYEEAKKEYDAYVRLGGGDTCYLAEVKKEGPA